MWFSKKPEKPLSLSFLEHLFPPHRFNRWTLATKQGATTFPAGSSDAAKWLESAKNPHVVIGDVSVSRRFKKEPFSERTLIGTRHIAISVADMGKGTVDNAYAFQPKPCCIFRIPGHIIVVWRFGKMVSLNIAVEKAEKAADALGGDNAGFMIPLPGQVDSKPIILLSPTAVCFPTQFDKQENREKEINTLFTNAAEAKPEPVSWLKECLVQNGVVTLVYGRPKRGKSLVTCDFAATVSRGGKWFDGSKCNRPGSVLFFETEDPRNTVLARLRAAGADMTKIDLGNDVIDLSQPKSVNTLATVAERQGDCRLLVLSPLISFFDAKDYNEGVVRSKLRPLLAWAEQKDIPVLGVMHLTKDGKNIGGSDVFLKTCRAAILCDDDPDDDSRRLMTLVESNAAETGASVAYRIKTVNLGGGVSAGAIDWLGKAAPMRKVVPLLIPSPTISEDPEKWVRRVLAGGAAIGAAALQEAAYHVGISRHALYELRAAGILDTIKAPGRREKLWTLRA